MMRLLGLTCLDLYHSQLFWVRFLGMTALLALILVIFDAGVVRDQPGLAYSLNKVPIFLHKSLPFVLFGSSLWVMWRLTRFREAQAWASAGVSFWRCMRWPWIWASVLAVGDMTLVEPWARTLIIQSGALDKAGKIQIAPKSWSICQTPSGEYRLDFRPFYKEQIDSEEAGGLAKQAPQGSVQAAVQRKDQQAGQEVGQPATHTLAFTRHGMLMWHRVQHRDFTALLQPGRPLASQGFVPWHRGKKRLSPPDDNKRLKVSPGISHAGRGQPEGNRAVRGSQWDASEANSPKIPSSRGFTASPAPAPVHISDGLTPSSVQPSGQTCQLGHIHPAMLTLREVLHLVSSTPNPSPALWLRAHDLLSYLAWMITLVPLAYAFGLGWTPSLARALRGLVGGTLCLGMYLSKTWLFNVTIPLAYSLSPLVFWAWPAVSVLLVLAETVRSPLNR